MSGELEQAVERLKEATGRRGKSKKRRVRLYSKSGKVAGGNALVLAVLAGALEDAENGDAAARKWLETEGPAWASTISARGADVVRSWAASTAAKYD